MKYESIPLKASS